MTFKEAAHALVLEAPQLDLRIQPTTVQVAMYESLKLTKTSSPSESPHSKQAFSQFSV
jgi:hypothetical protein